MARSSNDVTAGLHEAGGETADKRVTGAGGVHDLEARVRGNESMTTRLRDKAAAFAEGDNHGRHTEGAAELVQVVILEGVEDFFGQHAAPAVIDRRDHLEKIGERDELRFVGDEDVDQLEDAGVKVGSHRRRIEHGGRAGLAREPGERGH